jgi:hypothetical protein
MTELAIAMIQQGWSRDVNIGPRGIKTAQAVKQAGPSQRAHHSKLSNF